MASINDYIASIQKKKPSYTNLFSDFKAPTLKLPSLTAPIQSSSPASTPITSPTVVNKPPVAPPQQQSSLAQQAYINNVVAPPKAPITQTQSTNPPVLKDDTPKADTSYLDSYRDYLAQYAESLKPSDEINAARTKLGQVQQQIDERSLSNRREQEAKLDESGMLRGGAIDASNAIARRSASELADLGIAESGAARSLSALTGAKEAETDAFKTAMELNKPLQIGDNYYDPRTGKLIPSTKDEDPEDFTLSEGQSRYRVNPETGEYEKVASVAKTVTQSEAAITKALERDEKNQAARDTQISSIGIINNLLASDDLSRISGSKPGRFLTLAGGTATAGTRAQAAQLKSLTSLAERDKLKGTGTITDFEAGMLSSSANALNHAIQEDGQISMATDEVEQNLKNIRGVMTLKTGAPVTVVITDSSTGESRVFEDQTRKDLEEASLQGFLIDFQ